MCMILQDENANLVKTLPPRLMFSQMSIFLHGEKKI